MKTKARGNVRIRPDGRVFARVRYGKDDRLDERLPWATRDDRDAAAARATMIAQLCETLVNAGRRDAVKRMARECALAPTAKDADVVVRAVAKITKGLIAGPANNLATFKDVADDWVSGKLRKDHPDHVRKKKSFAIERGRLRRYIYPLIKDVPVSAFEKRHGDLVMSKLPARRIKTPGARRHIAQIINRVLNLAVMPLGLIKANPLPKGWLPRIESHRHYTCLFPREEAKLLGCEDVLEVERLFFGILDREGMRVSELADSDWWQWNHDEGAFTATKTKTDDPRMWATRPDVAAAMKIWFERHGKTKARPFVDMVPDEKSKVWIATRLRDALTAAGVTRRELFVSTEHTGKMRAHDLRATFVTVSLAEGKNETWIRDRTGHKTLAMIDRYRRTARQFEELKVGPLPDLVEALGWGTLRGTASAAVPDITQLNDEDCEGFRRRDSNPDKRIQKSVECAS